MSDTTIINLVFTITRDDGKPCKESDRRRLDELLCADGDCLSLEGGRFIISDESWSTPDLLNGKLYLEFEIDVEPEDDDDDSTPDDLCAGVFDAAILHMPEGLVVDNLTASIF